MTAARVFDETRPSTWDDDLLPAGYAWRTVTHPDTPRTVSYDGAPEAHMFAPDGRNLTVEHWARDTGRVCLSRYHLHEFDYAGVCVRCDKRSVIYDRPEVSQ